MTVVVATEKLDNSNLQLKKHVDSKYVTPISFCVVLDGLVSALLVCDLWPGCLRWKQG